MVIQLSTFNALLQNITIDIGSLSVSGLQFDFMSSGANVNSQQAWATDYTGYYISPVICSSAMGCATTGGVVSIDVSRYSIQAQYMRVVCFSTCTLKNITVSAAPIASLGGISVLSDTWSSTNAVTWTISGGAAFSPARYGASAVYSNQLVMCGGYQSNGILLNDCWASSTGSTAWALLSSTLGGYGSVPGTPMLFVSSLSAVFYFAAANLIQCGMPCSSFVTPRAYPWSGTRSYVNAVQITTTALGEFYVFGGGTTLAGGVGATDLWRTINAGIIWSYVTSGIDFNRPFGIATALVSTTTSRYLMSVAGMAATGVVSSAIYTIDITLPQVTGLYHPLCTPTGTGSLIGCPIAGGGNY